MRSIIRHLFFLVPLLLGQSSVFGQEVIPDFYKEPNADINRSHLHQEVAEHIDPFSGILNRKYTDLHIPGNGGFDIDVVRTYSSAAARVNPDNPAAYVSGLGLGWEMHFGRIRKIKYKDVSGPCFNRLANTVTDNPVLETADGSTHLLAYTGSVTPLMLSTDRWRVDCSAGDPGFIVYAPNGTRYEMTQEVEVAASPVAIGEWYTRKITDRNGNTATIEYAGLATPEIKQISTNDGRVVRFTYLDSGLQSRRISSVSSGGAIYRYGYTKISSTVDKYYLSSVTQPDGRKWSYTYKFPSATLAGNYLIDTVTYPLGGGISYEYGFVYFDSQANPNSRSTVVKSKSNSLGGSWQYSYSPGGAGELDVTTIDTPSGQQIFRHVGPNYSSSGTVWKGGLLISRAYGNQKVETYTWSPQKISSENNARPGVFLLKVDAGAVYAPLLAKKVFDVNGANYVTTYSNFDGYGNPRLIEESGPNGGSKSTTVGYFIDSSKWMIRQVASENFSGGATEYGFDSDGNVTRSEVDGVVTTFAYDGQGSLTRITNPRSYATVFSNHKRGIARQEDQPEGVTIVRTVDDLGNVLSETNGDGYKTSYTYNAMNQLESIDYPAGNSVVISYPGNQKVAQRGGLRQITSYNGFGDVVQTNLGGITTNYRVDALGRQTYRSNPSSSSGDTYTYDILDRVRSVKHADGNSAYVSYGAGNVSETDENGNVTTKYFRSYGDPQKRFLMQISTPEAGTSIVIDRNARDLITSISQGGVVRSRSYYSNYYLATETHPEFGQISYGRDAVGNMTSRTVGGNKTIFYYDGLNRMTFVDPPLGSTKRQFGYNRRSLMTSANTGTTARSFGYDANGNLASDTLTVGGWSASLVYDYDGNDKLSSIRNTNTGTTTALSPDVFGRPSQVSGYVNAVSYWPSGQIATITYSNGAVSSYGQNSSRLWPDSFTATKAGGALLLNSGYGYDGVGNLRVINDTVDGAYSRTLGYDAINRLTSAAGPWGSGVIRYNGSGDLTSQSFGGFALSYGYSGGRLASISGSASRSYAYDGYGNVTNDSTNTYTYDDHSSLLCSNCADPQKRVDYDYDATGKRVASKTGGVTTYEFFDRQDHLMFTELASSTNIATEEYFYLGNQRVAQKVLQWYKYKITSLTASLRAAAVGRNVRITAYVSGPNPPGKVNFYNQGVLIGSASVVNGEAVLVVAFPAVGDALITATYGDSYYSTSAAGSPLLTLPVKLKLPDISPILNLLLSANPLAVAS